MKKLFICLANSKKYQKRCVAGIELVKSTRPGYRYDIVRHTDGNPRWLRPVSLDQHGEIPALMVNHISLFDVVEVNETRPYPEGYQSENILFDDDRLEVVDTIEKSRALVEKLLTCHQTWLFGNADRAICQNEIDRLDHSLVFIRPTYTHVYETPISEGYPQIRADFIYNNVTYDLPVTDIGFISRFHRQPDFLTAYERVYLTISLGNEFEGWHYKLVAAVLYF